ncbi:MAG: M28 family peptidase [bacterium]
MNINAERIIRDWEVLCKKIGERRAGSKGETMAARFILKSMEDAGLDNCRIWEFPVISLVKGVSTVQIRQKGRWNSVESRVFVNSPCTPGCRHIEGELAWLEMPEQEHQLRKNSLAGKILVYFGPLPRDFKVYQKMIAANPAVIIHIDDRLPHSWTKDDCVYPYWAKKSGTPPAVSVPYMDAYNWRLNGAKRARVMVNSRHEERQSTNVIGEIIGGAPKAGTIVVSCHHDTQCGNVGADDNGSGVVSILEMVRHMSKMRFAHSIRFISFGTEEQLSVGSMKYVLHNKKDLKNIKLIYNIDSASSALGHFNLFYAGSPAFGKGIADILRRNEIAVRLNGGIMPFADHFAFTVFGIPAVWLGRSANEGGRWFHHSRYDNLDVVSVGNVVSVIRASVKTIKALDRKPAGFFSAIPQEILKTTRKYARDMFGVIAK